MRCECVNIWISVAEVINYKSCPPQGDATTWRDGGRKNEAVIYYLWISFVAPFLRVSTRQEIDKRGNRSRNTIAYVLLLLSSTLLLHKTQFPGLGFAPHNLIPLLLVHVVTTETYLSWAQYSFYFSFADWFVGPSTTTTSQLLVLYSFLLPSEKEENSWASVVPTLSTMLLIPLLLMFPLNASLCRSLSGNCHL